MKLLKLASLVILLGAACSQTVNHVPLPPDYTQGPPSSPDLILVIPPQTSSYIIKESHKGNSYEYRVGVALNDIFPQVFRQLFKTVTVTSNFFPSQSKNLRIGEIQISNFEGDFPITIFGQYDVTADFKVIVLNNKGTPTKEFDIKAKGNSSGADLKETWSTLVFASFAMDSQERALGIALTSLMVDAAKQIAEKIRS